MEFEGKNTMASRGLPSVYGYAAAPTAVATEDQDAGLDVWGFLRRRKSIIIVLGILGAGIGYLMFTRQVEIYRSTATVQVIHRNGDREMSLLLAERELMDAAYEIKSHSLIKPAFE